MHDQSVVRKNDSQVSIHFDSISSLLDSKPDKNIHIYNSHRMNGNYDHHDRGWYGWSLERDDVYRNALLGWHEGYESLKRKIESMEFDEDTLPKDLIKRRRKATRDSHGDNLDIHKVYQGNIDKAWTRMVKNKFDKKHNLVTVLIDVGAMANDNCDDTLWRAVVALKIIDSLQKAGKSVKVIVGSCARDVNISNNKITTTSIVVKHYNEPLSMERLAAMSYAGFHRTFNFLARTFSPYKINSSMGRSNDRMNFNIPIQIKEEIDEGHTKFIYLKRVNTKRDAQISLNYAYDQLVKISEN